MCVDISAEICLTTKVCFCIMNNCGPVTLLSDEIHGFLINFIQKGNQ